MTADLKYGYLVNPMHPEDRKYFAFTIPGMGQFQPTRMEQGSMTAGFTMSELMCRALSPIPESEAFEKDSEPFLIQGPNLDISAP